MIVVTGAAGFIGSNIVADLEERGMGPVAVVDWFGQDARWRNLAKRVIDAFIRPEDLADWLEAHAGQVRSVIHMGAISATTERDVDKLVASNINYSMMLWDWCAKHQVPFIYASSAATYGGIESGFSDDEDLEAMRALRPLNAYGWSKKATDLMIARRIADGLPTPPQWAGLKFFNVYGPNEFHKGEMMSVACKLYDQILRGESLRLFRSHRLGVDDGEQSRDFVYVKDCTGFIMDLLEKPQISGIFNVGSGKARTFLDVAKALGLALNREVNVEFIDMPEAIRGSYQYFTEADMRKAKSVGLAASSYTLEQGISDYVVRYLSCEDRYR